MKTLAWTAVAALGIAGCGTPPNQRMLTRTSSYMKAMSFGIDSGFPIDIPELEPDEKILTIGGSLSGLSLPFSFSNAQFRRVGRVAQRRGPPAPRGF